MPAISECACYESRGDSDRDADQGTDIHGVMSALVDKRPVDVRNLEQNVIDACEDVYNQAIAFIHDNCPGAPIQTEKQIVLKDDRGNVITFGTEDVFALGLDFVLVLDWKGCLNYDADAKDYHEQTHTYALAEMRANGVKRALCIEAYIMPRKIKPYWVTYAEAAATVEHCIARRNDPNRFPQPCDYCKWCSRLLTCPGVNKRMAMIGAVFAELPKQIACPEEIENPRDMAVALGFARSTAKKYIDAVQKVIDRIEDAAMAMSDRNVEIPYHIRVIKPGKKSVSDIDKAFRISGMKQEDFFPSLTLSLPKLAKAYAKVSGLKEKDARKEIEGRLNEVIVIGEAKVTLERTTEGATFDARQ